MSARRVAAAAVLASLAPVVVGIVTMAPAAAVPTPEAYDQYSLSALASGVRTGGAVGASGGLVTLDTGSGYVAARLDASPSSGVLADPYEPGTLFRTVAGQANAGAGSEVVTVPDAEASYPGDGKSSLETVPPQKTGPLTTGGGSATAVATETTAAGTATGSAMAVAGAFDSGGSSSDVQMAVDAAQGTVTSTATTHVSRISVGVLELKDVVAKASVTTVGDKHTSVATLTVGGASVSGQEVAVDQDGVHAVGTPLLPAQTIAQATKQANAVLKGAGMEVHATEAVHRATSRSADADTGGVVISLATPDLPGGVAANSLTVVVGGVSLTETDTVAAPVVDLPALSTPVTPPDAGNPAVTTTTVIPGAPGSSAGSGQAPVVAAPVTSAAGFNLVGHHVGATAALAAFAVWQFLTLGTSTLYALVERRRRLGLA